MPHPVETRYQKQAGDWHLSLAMLSLRAARPFHNFLSIPRAKSRGTAEEGLLPKHRYRFGSLLPRLERDAVRVE